MTSESLAASALPQAQLTAGAHGPFAEQYQDNYHGPAGALVQAQQVFLAQTRLPQDWRGRAVFTVLETGFGLGFNFLATWQAWQDDPQRCARLHFVSIEKHPVALSDLARAHAAEPGLAAAARALRQQWPLPLAGCHRLSFAGGRVTLTLVHGDGAAALAELVLQADVVFMDGFAPDRNPALWSTDVCRQLARLARPGARLATWCTAGEVRRALTDAGFAVQRQPGIAGKFHMLQGTRTGTPQLAGAPCTDVVLPGQAAIDVLHGNSPPAAQPATVQSVTIVGAGLAGTTLARALLQRGWQVSLIDAAAGAGLAASGNPSGVVRPLWSRDDNPVTRLTRSAFLHTIRAWAAGHDDGTGPQTPPRSGWHPTGVLQLAQDADQAADWAALLTGKDWPGEYVHWLDARQVAQRCGLAHTHGGLMFALGGWAEPARLCQEALKDAAHWPGQLRCLWSCHVSGIQPTGNGTRWQVMTDDGQCVSETDHVVFCSGAGDAPVDAGHPPQNADGRTVHPASDAPTRSAAGTGTAGHAPPFAPLRNAGTAFLASDARPLQALRGEITQLRATDDRGLDLVICNEGYLSPMADGNLSVGATYDRSGPTGPTAAGIAENLARAARIGGPALADARVLGGRVGWRSVAADRLPIAGADADLPGVWHLRALASRGVVWCSLMAELVACSLHGEPLPLLRSELVRVSPARTVLRQRPATNA